jgi:plasmid stabilization system protein ParE
MVRMVIWDEKAKNDLREAYFYIKKESLQQAARVKQEIILEVKNLPHRPFSHPPDKFRKDKDARFRSFEKFNYRISYFVHEEAVRVLRVRHVKRYPHEY